MTNGEEAVLGIITAWRERVDAGSAESPEDVVRAHPDCAAVLRDYFEALRIAEQTIRLESLTPDGASSGADEDWLRSMPSERYAHFDPIGRGGMGIVYLAIDTDLNREVAFKVARPGSAPDGPEVPCDPAELEPPGRGTPASEAFATLKQRFLREASITSRLEHPGVVPVYEVGRTDAGVPYYTMRFVRGSRTLAEAIEDAAGGGLEARLALLDPFVKVCDTIAYAHAEGVIHRDLKPENVVLGEFGEVVVIDWGLARFRDPDGALPEVEPASGVGSVSGFQTTVGAGPIGTLGYMAPEAVEGGSDAVDEQSDVYGLGVILFQILTGRLPREAGDLHEYRSRLRTEDAPDLRVLQPSAPEALAVLCARALARDRQERLPSVHDFAEGIRSWRARDAVDRRVEDLLVEATTLLEAARRLPGDQALAQLEHAGGPVNEILSIRTEDHRALDLREQLRGMHRGCMEERERAVRRRMLTRLGSVGLVLLLLAASVMVGVVSRERRTALEAARRNAALALASAAREEAGVDSMRALLLAREAVRRAPTRESVQTLRDAIGASHERVRIQGDEFRILQALFSPRGSHVVGWCSDGVVRLWDLRGREVQRWSIQAKDRPILRFAPDGAHVLFADWNRDIVHLLVVDTGERVPVGASGWMSEFSRDGTRLLTVRNPESGRGVVEIWDTKGRRVAVLQGHEDEILSAHFSLDGESVVTGSWDGTARIWGLEGRQQAVLRGHEGCVQDAKFRSDAQRVVTTSNDQTARIWDRDGAEIAVLHGTLSERLATSVLAERSVLSIEATLSPDGRLLAVVFPDNVARLFDWDGKQVADLGSAVTYWGGIQASPSSEHFVVPNAEGTAVVFDQFGQRQAVIWGGEGKPQGIYMIGMDVPMPLEFVSFSPDGSRVLVGNRGGVVRFWDGEGRQTGTLRGLGNLAADPVFSPDGKQLLTVGEGGEAHLLDVDGSEVGVMRVGDSLGTGAAFFDGDGSILLWHNPWPGLGGRVTAWRLDEADPRVLCRFEDLLFGMVLSPTRTDVLLKPLEGAGASVLDLRSGRSVTLEGSDTDIDSPGVFSPDGERILTRANEPEELALVWTRDGKLLHSVRHPDGAALATLAFSADGTRPLAGAADGTVVLWEEDSRKYSVLRGHTGRVTHISPSPDGSRILTASADGTARVWDRDGGLLTVFDVHSEPVQDAGWVGDARVVTLGTGTGASVWTVSGRLLSRVPGASGFWRTPSPDACRLWGSEQGGLRVWDLDGRELACLRCPNSGATDAAFSADGRRVVTTSENGSVRVWLLDVEDLLDLADERVTRGFTPEERARYGDLLEGPED